MTPARNATTLSTQVELDDQLAQAQSLVSGHDYDGAAEIYERALASDFVSSRADLIAHIETSLGALLIRQAQLQDDDKAALERTERAIAILISAGGQPVAAHHAGASATTAANLAIAYCERFRLLGNRGDIMTAHLALDGAEAVFRGRGDTGSLDWVRAVRDRLVEAVERRSRPR